MLHLARCTRRLLPLGLLLTAVVIHVCMPAEGSETEELRSARTQVADLEDEGAEEEEEVLPDQVLGPEEEEALGARWRKQIRRYYDKKRATVIPLIVVGVAAVYAAAGLMVYKLRGPVGAKISELWHRKGRGKAGEGLSFNTLVNAGKRVVPAAVALGIAAAAAGFVYSKYDLSTAFPNQFPWGGGSPADNPL